MELICGNCQGVGNMKCSGCNIARYCSVECQKEHWKKDHKHACYLYKTLPSKTIQYYAFSKGSFAITGILNRALPPGGHTALNIGCITSYDKNDLRLVITVIKTKGDGCGVLCFIHFGSDNFVREGKLSSITINDRQLISYERVAEYLNIKVEDIIAFYEGDMILSVTIQNDSFECDINKYTPSPEYKAGIPMSFHGCTYSKS